MDKNGIKVKNKERFLRSFRKRVEESGIFVRLGYKGDRPFAGKIAGESLFLYRRRISLLNLFAMTARGSFEKRDGQEYLKLSFGRCRPFAFFWSLWCLMLAGTGFYIINLDPFFALWFIVPGILLLLPLFCFSKREKARLRAFLQELAEL